MGFDPHKRKKARKRFVYFLFFLKYLLGEGEGGVRDAGRVRGGIGFSLKIPVGRCPGREGPRGREGVCSQRIGELFLGGG